MAPTRPFANPESIVAGTSFSGSVTIETDTPGITPGQYFNTYPDAVTAFRVRSAPEPGSLALFGGALGLMGILRRRKLDARV